MHIIGLLVSLAVEINDAVLYLECLSGKSHTTLHVVLATVCRTCHHLAVDRFVVLYILTTCIIQELVVVPALLTVQRVNVRFVLYQLTTEGVAHLIVVGSLILYVAYEGVASRIVEHHDVVEFYLTQSFDTTVVPVRPLYVRLTLKDRQCVLRKRHCQRSLGYSGSIGHLRHEEIVAREQ